MNFQIWALVAAGGAMGSLGRYLMAGWVNLHAPSGVFPWGTFVVNVLGCAVGGVIAVWSDQGQWLSPTARLFLFTGILGGFTTFSAFGLETLQLLRSGETSCALLYASGSVLAGVAAMALTSTLARQV
jgi:CrcB protein